MKQFLFVSAAVVVLSGSMFADTVTCASCVGGGSSVFPSGFASLTAAWTGSNPGSATPVFWNDPSGDIVNGSHFTNIGDLLTLSGGFVSTTSVIPGDSVSTDYVAAGGADPTAFSFVRNATAYNVTLLYANSGENTGANPTSGVQGSQIGYYLLSSPSTLIPLYNVGQTTSPTGTMAFNPSGNYGFYDMVCYSASSSNCETYTTSNGNSGAYPNASWNHFALFQLASGAYVLGFTGQNGLYGENIGDFQDTVIELSIITPEPGTIAIMGLGLAALGLLGRRRFAKK